MSVERGVGCGVRCRVRDVGPLVIVEILNLQGLGLILGFATQGARNEASAAGFDDLYTQTDRNVLISLGACSWICYIGNGNGWHYVCTDYRLKSSP